MNNKHSAQTRSLCIHTGQYLTYIIHETVIAYAEYQQHLVVIFVTDGKTPSSLRLKSSLVFLTDWLFWSCSMVLSMVIVYYEIVHREYGKNKQHKTSLTRKDKCK